MRREREGVDIKVNLRLALVFPLSSVDTIGTDIEGKRRGGGRKEFKKSKNGNGSLNLKTQLSLSL